MWSKNIAKTIMFPQSKPLAYNTILLISIFSMFMSNVDAGSNNTTGFSIDIFHRDSPLSPTYNSSLHPYQHLANAVQRSIERARLIDSHILNESPYSYILFVKGTYLTSFNLGTPPVAILSAVDTGSSLTWTQCKGCSTCFYQASPYFDPHYSSTYKRIACSSTTCTSTYGTDCDIMQRIFCKYKIQYADKSFSLGQLARDTITFRSTDRRLESFPSTAFGCGFSNDGVFTGQESGILGIGSGYSSLIRQLDYATKGKFSYCLISFRSSRRSSRLNFGDNAFIGSGPGVVSTPLVAPRDNFYFVILDAVSVGNTRLEYIDTLNDSRAQTTGNIIIDSGSTVTFLNSIFYERLVSMIKNSLRLRPVADPKKSLTTCFSTRQDIKFLEVTFHFRGANVVLKPSNLFVRTGVDVVCLAVKPSAGVSIYGSLAQVDFLVGFDLKAGRVAFKPADCDLV